MRLMAQLAAATAVLVTLLSAADLGAQKGEAARLPDKDSPKNDPAGAGAVGKVAKDFKGTHDIAGAAEALVKAAGPKFTYDYGFDIRNPLYTGLTSVTSLDSLFSQRLLVCYEFVHYVAYLSGNQRVTDSGAPKIVGSDDTVWDERTFFPYYGGDIPRGKIIIFKGIAFNNSAGFYHVGVSLGGGRVAHNSSNGNVQISNLSDVDSIGYSEIYFGDYPWTRNGDSLETDPPDELIESADPTDEKIEAMKPSATKPAESKSVNGLPPAPPNNPTVAPGNAPAERPSTGLRDALDAAPGGMRVADNASCCGDPLGKRVPASTAPAQPQYQLLITAGGIDRSINSSPTEPVKNYALRGPRTWLDTAASKTAWLWRGAVVYAAAAQPPTLSVALIATGRSSGDALRVAIGAPPGYRGRLLASDAMMVEATAASAPVPQEASRPGVDVSAVQAFCAQFVKLPPAPGTVYRVASDAVQAQYRPLRKLLRAADTLKEAGRLHPDSEPGGYLTFIKQYALWSKLEGWDAKQFESHLLDKGRDAAVATGRAWTRDLEAAVRKSVPGRWADVQQVIAAAR